MTRNDRKVARWLRCVPFSANRVEKIYMTSFRVSTNNSRDHADANMSPLTWMTTLLNRSLTALLYSKNQHLLGKQYPCM